MSPLTMAVSSLERAWLIAVITPSLSDSIAHDRGVGLAASLETRLLLDSGVADPADPDLREGGGPLRDERSES